MLSCKKASGLIEKKKDFGLSPVERFQLFLHTSMCDACKSWQKQSTDMDAALNNHFHSGKSGNSTESLSEETKQKIIKKLKDS